MARKEKKVVVAVEAVEPVEAPQVIREVEEVEAIPSFTLRADRRFDMLAMIAVLSLAREGASPQRLRAIEETAREFELWEASHA